MPSFLEFMTAIGIVATILLLIMGMLMISGDWDRFVTWATGRAPRQHDDGDDGDPEFALRDGSQMWPWEARRYAKRLAERRRRDDA